MVQTREVVRETSPVGEGEAIPQQVQEDSYREIKLLLSLNLERAYMLSIWINTHCCSIHQMWSDNRSVSRTRPTSGKVTTEQKTFDGKR